MTPIIIPCPQCGRELKIRDRNLLGRKGKCPKCGHAFVMEEPAAVELELAENTYPAEGIGARYIAPNAATPTPALTGTPPVADAPLASLFTPEMRETPIQIKKISARGHWIKFVAAGVAIL
ncbi:MAG TPA: hypothetical protein VFG20_21050, partial [Planctomycetaceae bacterium]|nr:hypothetical protein [Planctomycetaceae bacterium]